MGYTTDFDGQVTVTPPLNPHEIAYLLKFAGTRRMRRDVGPYFVDGSGIFGQGDDAGVRDHSTPPPEQPGLWCDWEPSEDGTAIRWNDSEKFYDSADWMRYLIDTFLKPGAVLQQELAQHVPGRAYPDEFAHFTFDHVVNGEIHAQGQDHDDTWALIVRDGIVTRES